MKALSPLSPEVESLMASQRTVVPVAASVAARAIARAAATPEERESWILRFGGPPRWVFAGGLVGVLVLGAAAYAARARIAQPVPEDKALPTFVPTMPARFARRPVRVAALATAAEVGGPTLSPPSARPQPPGFKRPAPRRSGALMMPTNAELELLRNARRDLGRGDFAAALATTGAHARRFRNGSLVEEREALRVKALSGLGRHQDAQRAAAQFHARFPHSVLLSTFERLTEARP